MGWRVDMGACVGVCGRTVLYMGNEWVPLRTAVLVGQIDARDGRYGTWSTAAVCFSFSGSARLHMKWDGGIGTQAKRSCEATTACTCKAFGKRTRETDRKQDRARTTLEEAILMALLNSFDWTVVWLPPPLSIHTHLERWDFSYARGALHIGAFSAKNNLSYTRHHTTAHQV